MKTIILTLSACLAIGACASANASPSHKAVKYAANGQGQWKLNPRKCPDLMEDRRQRRAMRRDKAHTRGPLDLIEDWTESANARRDEAVTNCPARAWKWVGPRYRPGHHAPRPTSGRIYYHPKKRIYYRHQGTRRIVIRF
jgi:hypothetical protein